MYMLITRLKHRELEIDALFYVPEGALKIIISYISRPLSKLIYTSRGRDLTGIYISDATVWKFKSRFGFQFCSFRNCNFGFQEKEKKVKTENRSSK